MRLLGIAGVPLAHCRDWVQCALGSDATESFLNSVYVFAGEKSAQRSINNQRARLKSILPECFVTPRQPEEVEKEGEKSETRK